MRIGTWLTAAVLVLLTGCGSHGSSEATRLPSATGSSNTGIDRAFWARTDAACRPLQHWFDVHPKALDGFDPVSPTRASLRRFAVIARRVPLFQPGALAGVARQVGEPTGHPQTWAAVVDDFHHFDALTHRQTRDAVRGDVRAWHHDYDAKRTLLGKLGSDLYGAGIPDHNQCALLLSS